MENQLIPLGLPHGVSNLPQLNHAIEERLSKFIKLNQFHFRYAKEMLFDIVSSLSSWRPDSSGSDVDNIRSALEEVSRWGEKKKNLFSLSNF